MNERNSYELASAEPLEHVAVKPPADSGPNIYALQMEGDCMEPEYRDGGTVICDPDSEPVAGDVVAVWFRDGKTPPSLKRLVLGVPPAAMWEGSPDFDTRLEVEQDNPYKRLSVSTTHVEAVHKVVGTV